MNQTLKLYHYWRSSSSWRVRWALEVKKLKYTPVQINLLNDETESQEHLRRNPLGYVPVLEIEQGNQNPSIFMSESVAILEWLEETYPNPSYFSQDPMIRAQMRQLAEIINSGTQPLQNPNVVQRHSSDTSEQKRWIQEWIRKGLKAYQSLIFNKAREFSMASTPTYPDFFLIPQCYNSLRFEIDLKTEFPLLNQIYQNALSTHECQNSAPERFTPQS